MRVLHIVRMCAARWGGKDECIVHLAAKHFTPVLPAMSCCAMLCCLSVLTSHVIPAAVRE